jgi:bifunctional non-homologous end joining protein LigD
MEREKARGTVTANDLYVEPMLATLVREPFDDPDWLFETKWDGFRVEACIAAGEVRLWTRGRKDAAGYFGAFLSPPTWLAADEAIIDGEVVALDEHGEPDFGLLQQRIGRSGGATADRRVVYQAFDLLYLDGSSLLDVPLEERKARLRAVVRDDDRIQVSDHVIGDGRAFFETARERRLEGIVAKERHSPYLPGRRAATWLKIKIRPEQELVVVGWTTGIGYATDLGALLVAVNEGGGLRYVGKIGAGFNQQSRADLVQRLVPLGAAEPAVENPPTGKLRREAKWVRPELVIRAEFAGWTGDGNVRQASYKGIEVAKAPTDVVREVPRTGPEVRP